MNLLRITAPALVLLMVTCNACIAQKEVQPEEKQIKAAVSALPEGMREGAGVLGYNQESELVTLRERTNELICLADDPADERFHVACYHYELEPFMKRGRELRAEGKSSDEVTEIRRQEIESGKIPMPEKPMALYSLTSSEEGYDYTTNSVLRASPLYVVYVPYATEQSTGIAPRPISEGAPWLMNPGEPWAHIMVSTGKEIGKELENKN